MSEIKIIDDISIYNDMPKGWVNGKGSPKWHKRVYEKWMNMWKRCKNPNRHDYINYKDCDIYDDFKYLSKYVDWIMKEPLFDEFINTYDKVKWDVDKDIKYPTNRNYYPECMTLIPHKYNSIEMFNRNGNPGIRTRIPTIGIKNNKILLFKSILDTQNKGFDSCNVNRCVNKVPHYKSHKGYKWYRINYKHNLRLRKV